MVAPSKLVWSAAIGCLALAKPLVAEERAQVRSLPLDCRFDLGAPDRIERDQATQQNPEIPLGTDLRAVAFDPPAVAIVLAKDGPVFSAGALGKTRKGVPGLAHVAIGWDF